MISIIETKDHKTISELASEVQNLHANLHPEIFKPFNKEEMEKAVEVFLSDPNCRCYVAQKDSMNIGYILCFVKEVKENAFHYTIQTIYIDQIAVLEKYQRTGAGKMLMEQVEKFAKEKSINKIELDHWTSNLVAAKYFRKNGYRLSKERLVKLI